MKKKEYVTKISEKLGYTKKEVEQITDAFILELINTIDKKELVTITNFGTFRKSIIKNYEFFSPINGERLKRDIVKVTFSVSKELSKKLLGEK